METTGRDEYKERIISEFERVHKDIEKLGIKIDNMKDGDLTNIKVKIAIMEQEMKDKAAAAGQRAGIISGAVISLIIGIIVAVINSLIRR